MKGGKPDGLAVGWYENGVKMVEGTYRDGGEDGPRTWWHENGQKAFDLVYKAGKLVSANGWRPNGEKCPVTNVVNGNGDWVSYNEDGSEYGRTTYRNGELIDWKSQ